MADHRCTSCGADVATGNTLCSACRQRERLAQLGRKASSSVKQIGQLVHITSPAVAPAGMDAFPIGGALTGPAPAGSAATAASGAESVQRRSRFRKPRYVVPIGLLLVVILVIAFYALRIRETFDTINSVSTIAPSVSGDALGGSANITIDAGPAMTAMAGGIVASPTATETLEPSPTEERATESATEEPTDVPATETSEPTKQPTDTPQPTATATEAASATSEPIASEETADDVIVAAAEVEESTTNEPEPSATNTPPTETSVPEPTATIEPSATSEPSATNEPSAMPEPSATPEPTAEPTQTLSEIDRIKNGDFELGAADWYVEQGAAVNVGEARSGVNALTINETGGFAAQRVVFVPETTYFVSMWVKLSIGSAEDAQVGIGFMDEGDSRLTDLEPPITKIDSEQWTEVTYEFVAPENASAVQVYFWKPSGRATLYVDDVSVRSVVPPEALNVDIQESEEGSMTVLLMGVDAREGEAIDIGVRPDSLMVLHLNANSGSCRLLSIPRDTRTDLPGYGMTKVNHALAVGGVDYQIQVVEQMLGLGIDHYMLIDFNGFQDLVDAVGGITVDVPADFTSSDGQVFYAGQQQMTGKQALSYARWRGGADGDFGRIQRQQQILRALVQRASGLNVVASINELLPAVERNLRTDLSATEMTSLAMDYRSRCTQETISMFRLEGFDATYLDPMLQLNLYYIEVDAAEIRRKVAALLEA
jgi:LCP family protein required for cell wall assembly